MRILQISDSVDWSGGTNQLYLLQQSLIKNGYNVILVSPPESELSKIAFKNNWAAKEIKMRQDYDLIAARQIGRIIAENKIDLIHAHHPKAHAISLLATLGKKNVSLIVTRRVIHAMRKNPFSYWKYNSRKISRLIAVSEEVKKNLLSIGVKDEKIIVIPDAVDVDYYRVKDNTKIRQSFNIPPAVPLVGTVANYSDYKGHTFLLEAAKKVISHNPGVKFILAGRDTEKLLPLVKEFGITANVILAGFRQDVPDILAGLDVFVLPSLKEGLGSALLEAMAAGVPAIATRVGGMLDVIEDGKNGLSVPPSDALALEKAITNLLNNRPFALKLAENGYRTVQEKFAQEKVTKKIVAVYENCLKNKQCQ